MVMVYERLKTIQDWLLTGCRPAIDQLLIGTYQMEMQSGPVDCWFLQY